jgi:hypothetical protein
VSLSILKGSGRIEESSMLIPLKYAYHNRQLRSALLFDSEHSKSTAAAADMALSALLLLVLGYTHP